MDYEKKYKSLVEAVKTLKEANPSDDGIQNWVNDNVPELAESEDERMRKAIISYFQRLPYSSIVVADINVADVISWLEKQGESNDISGQYKNDYGKNYVEHKLADKVESKFKDGDWIVENGVNRNPVQIKTFEEDKGVGIKVWFSNGTGTYIDFLKGYHKWTIEDGKDGDVLSYRDGQWIFIYKEKIDDNSFCYHALYSTIHQDLTINDAGFTLLDDAIVPATREQRDLLFQKMKEAGYEWDAKKKELRKIEQKPAWSEEDEVKINRIVACLENLNVADNDILLKDVDWLKSFRPQNHWKPSDEQMEALNAINVTGCISYSGQGQKLINLYNDLKKLK